MWHLLILIACSIVSIEGTVICSRRPPNTDNSQTPVDENFVISIARNPETYILGQEYNVSLNAFNGNRILGFILALESENGDFNYLNNLGRFELTDTTETRFMPNCINMVENTNPMPKTHVHLTWTAPTEPGSGCILIRATVLQHRNVWHMDDGGLTRRICEEVVDDVESQPTSLSSASPCCACDEARYELIFEGIWSRNLHPKNFPQHGWEARFCELIGAAHTSDYRFWEAGALASPGVKEYAELCSSKQLDEEFKADFRDQKIRTIIKARGPSFPNLNSKTSASVRVNPVYHMVSLASKIEPSPDWIVGVSGLELCLRNCTWLESKMINLYPWDIGTDAGPTYNSSNQLQEPPDVIRRIRSDFPNDPRSPFYDESGAPMKPMATLTIRRQRIYDRRCQDEDSNNEADVPRECHTHPWSSWSDCSVKCGEGMQYRRRVYKQLNLAGIYNCNVSLYEEGVCQGQECGGIAEEPVRNDFYMGMQQRPNYQQHAECQVSPWGGWSECSVTCGAGFQTRRRQYLSPDAEMKCQGVHQVELMETQRCRGSSCLGNVNVDDSNGQYDEQQFNEPQPENEEQQFDNQNAFRFPVGDLKWGQDQRTVGQIPMSRQPSFNQVSYSTSNSQAANYGQDNAQRASFPSRTSGNYNNPRQRQNNGNRDFVQPNPVQPSFNQISYSTSNSPTANYGQMPRQQQAQRAPYHNRPSDNYNANIARFPGQRQNIDNRDFVDSNPVGEIDLPLNQISYPKSNNKAANYGQLPRLENAQRAPYQRRPSDNYNINNRNFVEQNAAAESEADTWQRDSNNNQNSFISNINIPDSDSYLSKRCFRMLQANPPCKNDTVTGNFWFYNFCVDECMIYSSDACDRNVNKFNKFETCEECRGPEFRQLQQQLAATQECRDIIVAHRADQQFWKEEYRRRQRQRG